MKHPKFSIICPAFNHEKYVACFIDSVLAQTVSDWELVIVDDCSSDNTAEIIKSYADKRIKFIQHKINGGINAALNTAVENASGNIFIIVASDDVMYPNALEKIGVAFDNNPNAVAVYCNLDVIDENNNPRADFVMPELKNRSRAAFLHDAFMKDNILYGPGMSMRAKYARQIFPASLANCIFQDYIQNVQLLIMGDVFVLPDKIIKYRVTHDQKNISAAGFSTETRCNLETDSLMNVFLSIKDINLLHEIFSDEIENTGINIKNIRDLKYFMGQMAMLANNDLRKTWGFHQIMDSYNTDRTRLFKEYGFQFRDLVKLVNAFHLPECVEKYKKYKRLFNVTLCVLIIVVLITILEVIL